MRGEQFLDARRPSLPRRLVRRRLYRRAATLGVADDEYLAPNVSWTGSRRSTKVTVCIVDLLILRDEVAFAADGERVRAGGSALEMPRMMLTPLSGRVSWIFFGSTLAVDDGIARVRNCAEALCPNGAPFTARIVGLTKIVYVGRLCG